jgi:hypothetical protein
MHYISIDYESSFCKFTSTSDSVCVAQNLFVFFLFDTLCQKEALKYCFEKFKCHVIQWGGRGGTGQCQQMTQGG